MLPRFILLMAATVTACEQQAVDIAAEAERVRDANQAWVRAEREADLDGIMPHIASNAIFQPPGRAPIVGREAVRDFYEEFLALPILEFDAAPDTIIVAASGDLAVDIGYNRFVLEMPDGPVRSDGKYMAVWQKVNNAWKCIAISWSANEPAG